MSTGNVKNNFVTLIKETSSLKSYNLIAVIISAVQVQDKIMSVVSILRCKKSTQLGKLKKCLAIDFLNLNIRDSNCNLCASISIQ